MNNEAYTASVKQELKVEFLSSSEELFLYISAIYSAKMWGREVDKRNQAIQERDKSLK